MSNSTLIIVIVVAVVVIVAFVVAGYQMARRKRTERLRGQYGPEYDRAIDQAESQRAAESELRDRTKRHEKLELRNLEASEREDFERRWSDVQGQFVDNPSSEWTPHLRANSAPTQRARPSKALTQTAMSRPGLVITPTPPTETVRR
jgi:FtsZ-interacting cell division protein ZipA